MKSIESIKVSVIIPLYNAQEYMDNSILSVRHQSHKNLEILLINDGSTDGTEDKCRQHNLQDVRVRVITQENGGPGKARNHGLDIATGEFVCFVDSDDVLDVTTIETMLRVVEDDCDLIQCRSQKVYRDNQEDLETWRDTQLELNHMDAMKDYLWSDKPIVRFSVWAKLFRRSRIANLRFPEMNNSEDVVFNAYFIKQCRKIVYIPDILYFVTVREGSLSRGDLSRKKMESSIRCNELILNLILQNEPYSFLKNRAYWSSMSTIMTLACSVYKNKNENWKEDFEFLKRKGNDLKIPRGLMNTKQKGLIVFFRTFPKLFSILGNKYLR